MNKYHKLERSTCEVKVPSEQHTSTVLVHVKRDARENGLRIRE